MVLAGPTIGIVNGLKDTIDLLRIAFEQAGFRVVDAQARDIRLGVVDLAEFVARHGVSVLLFDVAIPYEQNWQALEGWREAPGLAQVPIVVTTTNKRALDSLVGQSGAIEIVGKPYDLEMIVDAIRRAAAARI